MRLIHVPFCFYPDPVGGTEIYVDALAQEQRKQGNEIVIAAPGDRDDVYSREALKIRRFAVSEHVQDLRDVYGAGDQSAARAFGQILDDEHPDLVHLHAFTRGVSLRTVREAQRRDIPVVFSYHTPTVSCQRGTLMRWGSEICDGALDVDVCTRCTLHSHGMSRPASLIVGSLPRTFAKFLGDRRVAGGMWTALRMTELVELRHQAFRSLMAEVDHVVALCRWVKELLLRNGIPPEKITVCRQGLSHEWSKAGQVPRGPLPVRVAFLGRMDPTKGAHVLTRALRGIPEAPIHLDIYGVVQGKAGVSYLKTLKRLAGGDARIDFRPPVPSGEVMARLQQYDALVVPSQCLETGPMVVLEAFAAGIPVIGSDLGGIAELVEPGVNGLLVEAQSIESWTRALQSLSEDSDLLSSLRLGIRPPRKMDIVAKEMLELYANVMEQRRQLEPLAAEV